MVTRDDKHVYRNEKEEIYLSVTQQLAIAGMVDFSMVRQEDLNYAAQRGQYVHEAVGLYLYDDLDVEGLDDSYRGYVKGFIKFMLENNIKVYSSEEIIYDDDLRTAGAYDIVCASFKGGEYANAVIEIKTPDTLPKTTGLQTAGYKHLYNKGMQGPRIVGRWALRLRNNGKYSLTKMINKNDISIFKYICHTNWWCLSNGIIPVGAKSDKKVEQLCKSIIEG